MWETPNVLEVDIHSYRAASLTATTNTHTHTHFILTHTHTCFIRTNTHTYMCVRSSVHHFEIPSCHGLSVKWKRNKQCHDNA